MIFKKQRSWHPVPSLHGKRGNNRNSNRFYFLGLQNHCRWWLQPWNYKTFAPRKKSYDQPKQHIKSRDITLPTKVRPVKAMVFPVVMYGCKSWPIKKAENLRTDAFGLWFWRRLLTGPWTAEIRPVNPKGNRSWIFIGRADAKAEAPILATWYKEHTR